MSFMKLFTKQFPPVLGQSHRLMQTCLITPEAITHIQKFRQKNSTSHEAGGQLFGKVNNEQITIIKATGPYRGDESSRYSYRSNPIAAQEQVNVQARKGLLYLGEWHTHAEDVPSASKADRDAMHKLLNLSKLNLNALLMLILGLNEGLDGLELSLITKANLYTLELREVE